VLQPEMDYEGADLPLKPSKGGRAPGRVRQLRDPAIFCEGKKVYLLYSVAGESGIAISELKENYSSMLVQFYRNISKIISN
jgi:hypothetical protein